LWRDYGQITRPDAQHTRCSHPLAVIGLKERIASFIAFADAADHAAKKGLRFGLEIEPDPSNTLTANALKVIGVAQTKSWLGKLSAQQWDLGHIWHVAADEIHRDLVAKGVPIAAEIPLRPRSIRPGSGGAERDDAARGGVPPWAKKQTAGSAWSECLV
jgi:hypothetical protein